MPTLADKEFGTITIRRSIKAQSIRMRVAPDGTIRISTPPYTPILYVRRVINQSRPQLRKLLARHNLTSVHLTDGMQIGKSHHLAVRSGTRFKVVRNDRQISVILPEDKSLNDSTISIAIREVIIEALRIEAKSYLPKRLAYLAEMYGYSYSKVRFSHASGRWGSCSSNGTISLNLALMKLPFELIDYVIIHELAHTRQMNHGSAFWELVMKADPKYKLHRDMIKSETPSI